MSLGLQGVSPEQLWGRGRGIEGYFLPSASFPQRKYCLETECSSAEGRWAVNLGGGRAWIRGSWGNGTAASTCIPHNSPGYTDTSMGAVPTEKFCGHSQQLEESPLCSAIKVSIPITAYTSKLFSCANFLSEFLKKKKTLYILASEFIGLFFLYIKEAGLPLKKWIPLLVLTFLPLVLKRCSSFASASPQQCPSGAHALQREFNWALRGGV